MKDHSKTTRTFPSSEELLDANPKQTMSDQEIERLFLKATNKGLDPMRDAVGCWLANACTLWAILFELSAAACFRWPAAIVVAVVVLLFFVRACLKLESYSGQSFIIGMLMSCILAPITFPFAMIANLGLLKD